MTATKVMNEQEITSQFSKFGWKVNRIDEHSSLNSVTTSWVESVDEAERVLVVTSFYDSANNHSEGRIKLYPFGRCNIAIQSLDSCISTPNNIVASFPATVSYSCSWNGPINEVVLINIAKTFPAIKETIND